MKIYKILAGLFCAAVMLSSCDVIEKPYEDSDGPIVIDSGEVRKVLIEEYTGFKCPQCPDGVSEIERLHNKYKDKFIAIAVHAGFFATPEANSIFSYDFRNLVANEWYKFFGIKSNPTALINRQGFPSLEHTYTATTIWETKVAEELSKKAAIKLEIIPSLSIDETQISAEINAKFLSESEGEYYLSVVLVQDSIIDSQSDNGIPIDNFVHNHVLRAAFNSTWGEKINTETIAAGTIVNKKYDLNVKVDAKHPWEAKHLKIIAFVYDANSYEVLQAEEVHVK